MSVAPGRHMFPAPPSLNPVKNFPADNRHMMIWETLPLAPGSGQVSASHFLFPGLSVHHIPRIYLIPQDGAYGTGCPHTFTLSLLSLPAFFPFKLCRCPDSFRIQNPCNPGRSHSLQSHIKNPSHNLSLVLRNHQHMPVPGILLIPERAICADVASPGLTGRKGRLHLHRQIFAVKIIQEISETEIQFPRMSHTSVTVVMIIYGNKPYPHKRKNLFQIRTQLNVIPGESGEILYNNTVQRRRPHHIQHPGYTRSVQICP